MEVSEGRKLPTVWCPRAPRTGGGGLKQESCGDQNIVMTNEISNGG